MSTILCQATSGLFKCGLKNSTKATTIKKFVVQLIADREIHANEKSSVRSSSIRDWNYDWHS